MIRHPLSQLRQRFLLGASGLPGAHHLRRAQVLVLIRNTLEAWAGNRASSMGAALAYYTALSLAPMALIIINLTGLLLGDAAARGELTRRLADLVGPQAADAIQSAIATHSGLGDSLPALLIGVVTLFMGATTAFVELQADLDAIWQVPAPRNGPLQRMLHSRLRAIALILSLAVLLLLSLLASTMLALVGGWFGRLFPFADVGLHLLNLALDFVITGLLFAAVFKLLPRIPIAWDDVWAGAALTAALFAAGKALIAVYIGHSAISSSWGAAGAFVALLVWIYYSAQLVLLGAEFTHQFALTHGSHRPREPAALPAPHPPPPQDVT